MGACGLTAVVVLLLATSALLPAPASASGRSLREGENPNSGEDAPAPTDSGQSSAAQQAKSKQHQKPLARLPSPPKDTKEGDKAQASASSPPPPPPPMQETNSQKAAKPPPGVTGPNGGMGQEDTGSQGRREETDKLKEAMEKCVHKCSSGKEFSACLLVSDDGNALVSIGNSAV